MVELFAEKIQGVDAARLQAAIVPVLHAHGVATAEVTFQTEQGGWILRVTVEALAGHPATDADGAAITGSSETDGEDPTEPIPVGAEGIELGFLTELSRDLSTSLDVADVVPHRYTLEVSSPGLERPLRSMRDFLRASGGLVKLRLLQPASDGQRVLRGVLLETHPPDALTLSVDGKPIQVRLGDIERANTIYEFPAQPKHRRATKSKPAKNLRH